MAYAQRLWTKDETEYLRKSFKTTPPEVLAKVLGRSVHSINSKAYCMGLNVQSGNRTGSGWSKRDLKFLIDNYGNMSVDDIAAKLKRTSDAVRMRAYSLGITKGQQKQKQELQKKFEKKQPPWREETDCTAVCICSSVIRGQRLEDIAVDLYRPLEQVRQVYERSLTDGTYNRVHKYMTGANRKSVDLGDRVYKLTKGALKK